jgi:alkylation response protein AidB-like acyl-CoA dehydrogenase
VDLTFSAAEVAFRDELRAWLGANHPGPAPAGDEAAFRFAQGWQRRLAEAGWAGVDWPREYGGRGATVTQAAIFFEELGRARVPLPANHLGILMGGPTLMRWGTDEQKARFLPGILDASEHWCQAFSEPDAGSDLAALSTRAVPDGDGWVVTGQKVWTSTAQYAKFCMLLARTDPEVPKHRGLTWFLLDMEQHEVDVRPLRQITGSAEFNEVFLEGARIPGDHVVGGVGNGWKVALTTLMNERAGLAFYRGVQLRQLLDELLAEALARGVLEDPVIADRVAALHGQVEILRLTSYRGLTATQKYGQPGPEGSVVKWMWSETAQAVTQLAADLLGDHAFTTGDRWAYELLRARGHTIAGGTTEILKNIVAERVLGLPRL